MALTFSRKEVKTIELIKKFWNDEEGIEFVEWALMCTGFALVVFGYLNVVTGGLQIQYGKIEAAVNTP